MFQFCCRDCCEDFKRLRGVVSQCEHCRQEKLLHEKLRFSGVEKSFCSEGMEAGKGAEGPEPPSQSGWRGREEGLRCGTWWGGVVGGLLLTVLSSSLPLPSVPLSILRLQGTRGWWRF